jgi:hypothetical protein
MGGNDVIGHVKSFPRTFRRGAVIHLRPQLPSYDDRSPSGTAVRALIPTGATGLTTPGGHGTLRRGSPACLSHISDAPAMNSTHAANHHEVRLVQLCFDFYMIEAKPEKLIGDRAYDSDPLDAELRKDGIEMIAPHRCNRSKPLPVCKRRICYPPRFSKDRRRPSITSPLIITRRPISPLALRLLEFVVRP